MTEMQDVAFSQQYQIYMSFTLASYFEDVQSWWIDICPVLESDIFRLGPKVLGGSLYLQALHALHTDSHLQVC